MQSFILLEIQHNAVGIIESPVCRRKGEKIRPFLTRGPFCHGSLQRAALHTVVCIPTRMWEFLRVSHLTASQTSQTSPHWPLRHWAPNIPAVFWNA